MMKIDQLLNKSDAPASASEGRNVLWDYIRGMAMLSVLLHHSGVPGGEYILAFHMPFFFILSGYITFARNKEQKFSEYIKSRFLHLMVPYFLFEALNLVLWQTQMILWDSWQSVREAVKSILYVVNTEGYIGLYGRLWFWPCMFVSEMIFFAAKKALSGKKLPMLITAAVLMGISWITVRKLPFRLPFTVDTAFFGTVFLILGYVFGKQIHHLITTNHIPRDMCIMISGLTLLYVMVRTGNVGCLMFINWYGNYLTTLIAILSGSAAFLVFSKWCYVLTDKIEIFRKLVLWYGRNSLVTFPVHLTIKIYAIGVSGCFGTWKVLFLTMLLLNIPVSNLITQYCPFMLGRFPHRRK